MGGAGCWIGLRGWWRAVGFSVLAIAATAMKLKQTGLAKKSLVVVPNHLLEQFAREFQQGYPNARLLVASKDDFAKLQKAFGDKLKPKRAKK